MEFKNDTSLKAYLKNESNRLGININNIYNTYFSRTLLERLSRYNNQYVIVKGSFCQFVHLRKFVRPITDIDLTSTENHHEPILILNSAMCDSQNDPFTINFRAKPYQKKTGMYSIPLKINYGRINHAINIDYRENHPCIFEKQVKYVPAVFKGDFEYPIVVPSIEETLAEKLCIVVESKKKDVLNTRVKDFYDIYQMHGGEYDLDKFSYYFEKMLEGRGKIAPGDVSTEFLTANFIKNHQEVWDNVSEKYEFLDKDINLAGAVYYTRGVLSEQVQKIRMGKNKVYSLSRKPSNSYLQNKI